ncbi:unnamed protein product [Rhizophagus irregularis]|nr:unnamed protein product [Rhizophagus irregularis]
MDVEHDDQNTEHQLEDVIAESSTKNSKKNFTKLNIKAIPIPQKEKDALSRLQKWSSEILIKTELAKKKQQCASPKEIQLVMTGYIPVLKDNIRKITLYDIPSTWAQLEIL